MTHSSGADCASLPKKFVNDPHTVVPDMLDGLCAVNTHLARLHPDNVVVRRECLDAPLQHVAVISGGGSGHEPMAGGFVGKGMLAAAVAGEVFASPNMDSVLAAIEATSSKSHGVLLVVLQYTGDRLCFGAAAAIARSKGIPVEMVLVGDDCALPSDDSHAGRRGLCGITFVLKIVGALAESGAPLSEVSSAASSAAKLVRTYGVAASACSVPGTKPAFSLGANEIELGLGIHGERGIERGPMRPVSSLVETMLTPALKELIELNDELPISVALAVNGLGGTPLMELLIVARDALRLLEGKENIQMAGFSLTLLRLRPTFRDLLLAPCEAPGWSRVFPRTAVLHRPSTAASPTAVVQPIHSAPEIPHLRKCIEAVCKALQVNKDRLTALDQAVGDGDLGISMATVATALSASLPSLPLHSLSLTLKTISDIVRKAIGGTSGPLYTVALLGAAEALERCNTQPHALNWATGLSAAAESISALGGAKVGDRTMLDALVPAAEACKAATATDASAAIARAAADAAESGATKTATLLPRKGRSSYLSERALGHADPGAVAIALQIDALAKALAMQ